MADLAQLPWHAAWTPDSRRPEGRRYACNRVVWRYAPGVKLLGEKRVWQPRRGKASETLVVRHTGANSPKLAEQEAQAIRTHMGPITELAETVITAPSVLKAWAKARYVHLATHGRSDPTDPMKTHLVLSDDNRLTVSDLLRARQPLAARLVTLAACEAAVTFWTPKESTRLSVSGGVAPGRVGQVLAPLWPVDDYATFRLMDRFYAQLGAAENVDLAMALARATSEMRTARGTGASSKRGERPNSTVASHVQPRSRAPSGRHSRRRPSRARKSARNSEAPNRDLSHPDHWAASLSSGCRMLLHDERGSPSPLAALCKSGYHLGKLFGGRDGRFEFYSAVLSAGAILKRLLRNLLAVPHPARGKLL